MIWYYYRFTNVVIHFIGFPLYIINLLQILLKALPTLIITTLNILMFLKLQKIWKQRRDLKKTMQAEAIPIIATPVLHHRTVSIKNSEATSGNCNDDVFESSSSSDKCLRYTTRLKVI